MRTKLWIACASVATCVRTRLRVRESAYLPADNCERDDGHASTNTKNAFYLQLLVPLVHRFTRYTWVPGVHYKTVKVIIKDSQIPVR